MTSLGSCLEPQCPACQSGDYQEKYTKEAKCLRQQYCDPSKTAAANPWGAWGGGGGGVAATILTSACLSHPSPQKLPNPPTRPQKTNRLQLQGGLPLLLAGVHHLRGAPGLPTGIRGQTDGLVGALAVCVCVCVCVRACSLFVGLPLQAITARTRCVRNAPRALFQGTTRGRTSARSGQSECPNMSHVSDPSPRSERQLLGLFLLQQPFVCFNTVYLF